MDIVLEMKVDEGNVKYIFVLNYYYLVNNTNYNNKYE